MRLSSIQLITIICIFAVCIPRTFARKQEPQLRPVIQYHDSTYTYQCSFRTNLSSELLLQIFHKYNHIKQYVNKTNISTVLIEEWPEKNIISYRYKYLVGSIQLTFIRRIDTLSNKVTFDLLQSSSTSRLIPKALQTHGYYEVYNVDGYQTVTYYQQTTLDRNLLWLYVTIINHETKLFLKELIYYLETFQAIAPSATK